MVFLRLRLRSFTCQPDMKLLLFILCVLHMCLALLAAAGVSVRSHWVDYLRSFCLCSGRGTQSFRYLLDTMS